MKTNRWIVAFAGMLLMVSLGTIYSWSLAVVTKWHANAARGGAVTRLLPAGQMHAVMNVLTLSGVAVLALGALAAWLLADLTSAARRTGEALAADGGHS